MPRRLKAMAVFGTRPEAVKMAPVVHALRDAPGVDLRVCVTAQHRAMLDQALALFDVRPDHDLDVMRDAQSLEDVASRVLLGLKPVLQAEKPDLVLVHGDTLTTFAAALGSFYAGALVGHVEAGLRTGDLAAPWPEEANRRLTAVLTALHFAPTPRARSNLLAEGVDPARIFVTGNTVVDALFAIRDRLRLDSSLRVGLDRRYGWLDGRRLVLVTGHRRESFGDGLRQFCAALRDVAESFPDATVVYPVHLNPNVLETARAELSGRADVRLLEPLPYLDFVYLMLRSSLIVTDSGGVQEEAASIGKPVIVTRDKTERPEVLDAPDVRLTGARRGPILAAARDLMAPRPPNSAPAKLPFGDGDAARKIRAVVEDWWAERARD